MEFILDEVLGADKSKDTATSIRIYLKPNPSVRPVLVLEHNMETPIPDHEVDPNMVVQSAVIDVGHVLYQVIVEKFQINLE